jgi:hypothetical protein
MASDALLKNYNDVIFRLRTQNKQLSERLIIYGNALQDLQRRRADELETGFYVTRKRLKIRAEELAKYRKNRKSPARFILSDIAKDYHKAKKHLQEDLAFYNDELNKQKAELDATTSIVTELKQILAHEAWVHLPARPGDKWY